MGALISLLMMLVSLTVSLLMMFMRLTMSLLTTTMRLAAPRGRRHGNSATGGLVLVGIVAVVLTLSLLASLPAWLSASLVLLGFLGLGVAGIAWMLSRRSQRPDPAELAQLLANVRLMSGPEFEAFMANVFEAVGHRATVLGGSGDQGVDILLNVNGQKVAVQCKNYARPVGNTPVQEVFAGGRHHGCEQAWVVAPAGYTQGARALAASVGVLLYDASAIQRWIEQAGGVTPPSDGESSPESEEASLVNDEPSPPPPVPSRRSPNPHTDQDRRRYDRLLNDYLSAVESLENYRDLRDLGQVSPGSDVEKQWRITLRIVNGSIRNVLLELDGLEESNPLFASDGRAQRRAEITATHEQVKREIVA